MRLWGLTGGIASGKSTVHRMFAKHGACVVDADAVYHSLVAPLGDGPSVLTQNIGRAFADVIAPDGALDRKALGKIVFVDAEARKRLEAITHPAVQQAVQAQLAHWTEKGVAHAIYDVPLLFERGMQDSFSGVIVVWIPKDVQLARLKLRDGLDDTAATLRLGAQLPLDDKRAKATWTIDNSGAMDATKMQVQSIWQAIHAAP